MNILIIANQIAGYGEALMRVPELQQQLARRGATTVLQWTQHRGHATVLARETDLSAFDRLVVAGGDGTVSEVIDGLHLPITIPIIIFGIGSQNILARELDLPRDPATLASVIIEGRARHVDLGIINQTARFLSLCSAGLDARVIRTKRIGRSPQRFPLPPCPGRPSGFHQRV